MKRTAISLVFSVISIANAQPLLTLDEAIAVSLKNNFLVQSVKVKSEIASTANTAGAAGMLPRAAAGFTGSAAQMDLDQQSASGPEIKTPNVNETFLNPSASVTWTLFDGFRMFATKSRLKRLAQIGEIDFKDTLQTVASQTIVAYYDIVSAIQQLVGIKKAIAVSEERVRIAEKQFQVGTISKVDLLQAKLDLNEQKSASLTQEDLITQKKTALNTLLARQPDTDFTTPDTIPFIAEPIVLSGAQLESQNFQLTAALKNVEIARYAKKEALSQFLPTLSVSGSYGLSRAQNSSGATLLSQSVGPSAGLSLTVPLFYGFNILHQYQIADLTLTSAKLAYDNAKLQVTTKYYQTQRDLQKAKDILKLEEDNIALADENVKIALERFRLVESTAIEMRTAELSYVNSLSRLTTARFNAKAAETELLRLQGQLVK